MVRKYAIVEDGAVVNIAVSEEPLAENWIASETAAIGDIYDRDKFTRIEKEPEPESEAAPDKADLILALLVEKGLFEQSDKDAVDIGTVSKVKSRN